MVKICEFTDEVCMECGMYCNVELQRAENINFCDGKCLCTVCKNE